MTFSLWQLDILLDGELHGLDQEVHASLDTQRELEGQEVVSKPRSKDMIDVSSNEPAESRGDADRPKLGLVLHVLVKAEEVAIRKEVAHCRWKAPLEDDVEEPPDIIIDLLNVQADEVDEGVKGVGVDPGSFELARPADRSADIPWKVVVLVLAGWREGWMAQR